MSTVGARPGSLYRRLLEDGRELTVYPLIMGTARLCIGDPDEPFFDDSYCYEHPALAIGVNSAGRRVYAVVHSVRAVLHGERVATAFTHDQSERSARV